MAVKVGDLQVEIAANLKDFDRAQRDLLSLKSSLGGVERANAQMQRAQDRLNSAVKAGLVGTQDAARLTKLMGERFNATAVQARSLGENMKRIADSAVFMKGTMIGVAAAVGAVKLAGFVNNTINAADAIAKAADNIGITTDALQEYRFAADLSGISTADLDANFLQFTKRIGEARLGTGSLVEFLNKFDRELLRNVQGARNSTEALDLIFNKMGQLENQTDRAALAAAAFGRGGVSMTNMVKDGAGALDAMRKQARDLGLVLDENLLRAAERTQDRLTILGRVISTKVSVAVLRLAPDIEALTTRFTEGLPTMIRYAEAFGLFVGILERRPEDRMRELAAELEKMQAGQQSFVNRIDRLTPGGVSDLDRRALLKQAEFSDLMREIEQQQFRSVGAIPSPARTASAPSAPAIGLDADFIKQMSSAIESARREHERFGETIRQQVLTPTEKFREHVQKLEEALAGGFITQETYNRALAQAGGNAMTAWQQADKLNVTMAKGTEEARQFENAALDLSHAIGTAFEDAIIRGEGLRGVLQGLIQDIQRVFTRALVTKPLEGVLTGLLGGVFGGGGGGGGGGGLFSGALLTGGPIFGIPIGPLGAKGFAFEHGVQRMAKGGVLSGPTLFGHAGGMALAGEAGTEAVLPLTRTTSGDLGVRSQGGGQITQNFLLNVQAGVAPTVRAEMMRLLPLFKEEAKAAVFEARRREPSV